ncbi:MAG: glycosyltransferase family 4 protein [Desulfarculaceae bacterium]
MRIALVIAEMGAGGAERVVKVLAEAWAERGHQVTLITLSAVDQDFYSLDPRIKRIGLDLMRDSANPWQGLKHNWLRLRRLRRALGGSQPQVIISHTDKTNVLTILAALGLGTPVVACEHIDPFIHQIGAVWQRLRRFTYPRAGAIVGVTKAAESYVRGFVKTKPVLTIPNPIQPLPPAPPEAEKRPWPQGPTLISMGRLSEQKNFSLLIKAFAVCLEEHPSWHLVILGEGEERAQLTDLAAGLGISDKVYLPGRVEEPAKWLRQADLFALSSHYEGFPMSLLEAMACGLPVLSTDCSTGIREIIRPDLDGVIVPPGKTEDLAAALAGLMADPGKRAALAQRAAEVTQRFGLETVLQRWDDLFTKLNLKH